VLAPVRDMACGWRSRAILGPSLRAALILSSAITPEEAIAAVVGLDAPNGSGEGASARADAVHSVPELRVPSEPRPEN
jgi:hypothetical protein